jgi:hypothetical protein
MASQGSTGELNGEVGERCPQASRVGGDGLAGQGRGQWIGIGTAFGEGGHDATAIVAIPRREILLSNAQGLCHACASFPDATGFSGKMPSY